GWAAQSSGVNANLNALDAQDAKHVWAVGDACTIVFTTNGGTTWTKDANVTGCGGANLTGVAVDGGGGAGWGGGAGGAGPAGPSGRTGRSSSARRGATTHRRRGGRWAARASRPRPSTSRASGRPTPTTSTRWAPARRAPARSGPARPSATR